MSHEPHSCSHSISSIKYVALKTLSCDNEGTCVKCDFEKQRLQITLTQTEIMPYRNRKMKKNVI